MYIVLCKRLHDVILLPKNCYVCAFYDIFYYMSVQ